MCGITRSSLQFSVQPSSSRSTALTYAHLGVNIGQRGTGDLSGSIRSLGKNRLQLTAFIHQFERPLPIRHREFGDGISDGVLQVAVAASLELLNQPVDRRTGQR